MNEQWQNYYNEVDPGGRVAIYAENIGGAQPDRRRSVVFQMRHLELTGAEDSLREEDLLRKELFLWRHNGPKGQEVDKVMIALMELMHIGRNQNPREVASARRILLDLGWGIVQDSGEAGEELLALELQNGTRRYLTTCRGAGYARSFMGLLSANAQRQNDKTTEDIWMATRGIERLCARRLTEEELTRLHIYEDAVLAAFYAFDKSAADWFAEYERMAH